MNEVELPELGNAWQHAQNAINYGKEHGHTEIEAMGYKIIGDIYARLESPVKAAETYQKGLIVDQDSFMTAENAARLGVTLGLLGDPKADALLEDALNGANAAGLETIEFNARALRLSLLIARKEYAAFDKERDTIIEILAERSHPKSFVWTDYLQAQRLCQEAQYPKALSLLENTLPILNKIEFFWIRLRAQRLHLTLLKKLQRDTNQTQAKIDKMLGAIEAGLGEAPIQAEWQEFAKKVRQAF